MQAFAEEAVAIHISSLQEDFFRHWDGYTNAPFPEDFDSTQVNQVMNLAIKRSVRYKRLKSQGKSKEEIDKIFDKKTEMKLFSWKGKIDTVLSPRDSILYSKYFLHSGMMSMEPSTGHVKAYVGGINYENFQYDHGHQEKDRLGLPLNRFYIHSLFKRDIALAIRCLTFL